MYSTLIRRVKFLLLIFFISSSFISFSQPLSGYKTICTSGCDYPSLAAAISALNTNGVGSGGVVIEIPSGYTETIPSGGYSLGSLALNSSLSATNSVIIRRMSTFGSKPVFTSGAGTGTLDAMFRFAGADFVTLDGLVFQESAANTTSTTAMEYGIALLKRSSSSPIDGSQNNTIANCEIILRRSSSVINYGIYLNNHTTLSSTQLSVSLPGDLNSYNTFQNNVIYNSQTGILLSGSTTSSSVYDAGNRIGGVGLGNTIAQFGPVTSSVANGISVLCQSDITVNGNAISGGSSLSGGAVYGISVQTCSRAFIQNNTITDTSASGNNYPIYQVGTSGKYYIEGNLIQYCKVNTALFSGIFTNAGDSVVVSSNQILNNRILNTGTGNFAGITLNGASGKYLQADGNTIRDNRAQTAFSGIYIGGSGNRHYIFNNDIVNDTVVSGSNYGVYLNYGLTASTDSVAGNRITNLKVTGSGAVYGIYRPVQSSAMGGNRYYSGNLIANQYTKMGNIIGIEINSQSGLVTINGNEIRGFLGDSINHVLTGIFIGTGVINSRLTNNAISDFITAYSSIASTIRGIYISGGSSEIAYLYHNTVYLNATGCGNLNSYCVMVAAGKDIEMRNNVLVNRSLAELNGLAAGYYRTGTSIASHRAGSDFNLIYVSGTPGRSCIFYDGISKDTTLIMFKARMAPMEANSVTENVVFSAGLLPVSDLSPHPLYATRIESGAMIADTPFTVYSDIKGNPRNRHYPDLGAFEGNYILLDSVPPAIVFEDPQPVSVYQPSQTISVSVYDRFGIKVNGAYRPLLYFKKKSENNSFSGNTAASNGWKYLATADSVSPFRYQINYSLLTSAPLIGDTIQFFAVAADSNLNYSSGTVSLQGPISSVLLSGASFPALSAIPYYPVLDTISGVFTVGTGGNFTSLTQALNRYYGSVQTGPVEFKLTDTYYYPQDLGGREVFPIQVKAPRGMSAGNYLYIHPSPGINATIFGSSDTSLFIINEEVNGLRLNGSNNSGNSRNLSMINTSSNAITVLLARSTGVKGGIRNVDIRNLNLKGGNGLITHVFMVASSPSASFASVGKSGPVSSFVLSDCQFYNGFTGIAIFGKNAETINGLTVQNNLVGTDSVYFPLSSTGIYMEGVTNAAIRGNRVFKLNSNNGRIMTGILWGSNIVNSVISGNTITNLACSTATGAGGYGIHLSSSLNVLNDSIYNNSISDLLIPGSSYPVSTSLNTFGIRLQGGTNLKVYYNSVQISNMGPGGFNTHGSAALLLQGPHTYPGLEIKNNILSNVRQNTGSGCIISAFWTDLSLPLSGTVIDYNDLYVSSSGAYAFHYNNSDYSLDDMRAYFGGFANSVSVNPLFVSNSDLRPSIGSSLKSASPVSSVVRDITDSLRNSATPQIGCFEFTYDVYPPYFGLHNNAANNWSLTSYTLLPVSIRDSFTHVDHTTGKRPRIYFKKKSENNTFGANTSSFNGWKWVEATGTEPSFVFTLNYALLTSPPVPGDSVYYFIVSQDSAGNASGLPSTGLSLSSVSSISASPVMPFRFMISQPPLSGVYKVGSGGAYTTLTAAVTDLHQRGVSAPVTFLLTNASYTTPAETFPITFSGSIQGVSEVSSVSIRPAPGVSPLISAVSTGGIIRFNGTSHISINGSDTLTQAGRRITLRNNTSSPVIYFENDASSNELRNCIVNSDAFLMSTGIVTFGSQVVNGNDNNWIDSCFIGPYSASRPTNCICANTSTLYNVFDDGNRFTNNEIYNPSNYGIYLSSQQANAIITGNSFYRSVAYSSPSSCGYLVSAASGSCTISNNYFGGTAARCGGSVSQISTDAAFNAVYVSAGTAAKSVIQNNTFRNFSITAGYSTDFSIIRIATGKVEVSGNRIGNDTGTANIQFNFPNTVQSASFNGILAGPDYGLDSVWIRSNRIGAIECTGYNLSLNGIWVNSVSGNVIADSNLIGSESKRYSILNRSAGSVYGIYFYGSNGVKSKVTTNRVVNLSMVSPMSALVGIAATGNAEISVLNNLVKYLEHKSETTSSVTPTATLTGIHCESSSSLPMQVSGNEVSKIRSTYSIPAATNGIFAYVSNSALLEVSRNRIRGPEFLATVLPPLNIFNNQTGISISGQNVIVHNNEVTMGSDSSGNSITLPFPFTGIRRIGSGNGKLFFNSVNISGSNVLTTVNGTPVTSVNTSACSILYTGNSDSVYNNIFINSRSNILSGSNFHYAVMRNTASSTLMDYNLLYAPGTDGILMIENSTTLNSLPSIVSSTGTNIHSRSKPVLFVSSNQLKLAGTSIGDTSLSGVPRSVFGGDIEGDTRDAFKPYIGCDEVPTNPLPVIWLSVQAQRKGEFNEVSWSTSAETGCKEFTVERSTDGKLFTAIGSIACTGGNKVTRYRFEDTDVGGLTKTVYYRVKQQDMDGSNNYSVTVVLEMGSGSLIAVYPNPAVDFVQVTTGVEIDEVNWIDMNGRVIAGSFNKLQDGSYKVARPDSIVPGLYVLHIMHNSGNEIKKVRWE